MRLEPVGTRIVLQLAERLSQTPGGLAIPEGIGDEKREGVVVAVGPAVDLQAYPLKPGDLVVAQNWSGFETEAIGLSMYILDQTDILAVIRGAEMVTRENQPISEEEVQRLVTRDIPRAHQES